MPPTSGKKIAAVVALVEALREPRSGNPSWKTS
jgi:hypothetical protein